MVSQDNVVYLVFLAQWVHLVRMVIRENLVNQVKKATKDPKEIL